MNLYEFALTIQACSLKFINRSEKGEKLKIEVSEYRSRSRIGNLQKITRDVENRCYLRLFSWHLV